MLHTCKLFFRSRFILRSWQQSLTCAGCAKPPASRCANSPGKSASPRPTSAIRSAADRFPARMSWQQWPRPSVLLSSSCSARRNRADLPGPAAKSAWHLKPFRSCPAASRSTSLKSFTRSSLSHRQRTEAFSFSRDSGVAFPRGAQRRVSPQPARTVPFTLPRPRARGLRGAVERSDTHHSPRARIAQGPLELPTGNPVRVHQAFPFSCGRERLKKMRQHFHAARRGSQSAYKARHGRATATSAFKFPLPSPLPIVHSRSCLFRRTTRDVARGKRLSDCPPRSPRF